VVVLVVEPLVEVVASLYQLFFSLAISIELSSMNCTYVRMDFNPKKVVLPVQPEIVPEKKRFAHLHCRDAERPVQYSNHTWTRRYKQLSPHIYGATYEEIRPQRLVL
jgi:hypothetical protein